MALDHLLAALEREARSEADRLLAEARAAAEQTTAASDARLAAQRERSLGARLREQQAELESALSVARLSARHQVLDARERLLDRILAALRAACPAALASEGYQQRAPERIAAALACIDPVEPVILSGAPPLGTALARAAGQRDVATVQEDATLGSGFRVATTSGTLVVTDTLEGRIAARRPELARLALHQLGLAT